MKLTAREEAWELKRPFVIARETQTDYRAIVAEIEQDGWRGRGEAAGVDYCGETPGSMLAALQPWLLGEAVPEHDQLDTVLPPGGARNALDCAWWDLKAKQAGQPIWKLAGLAPPRRLRTAETIGLGTPGAMAEAAREASSMLVKLKLGCAEGDLDRLHAVRRAVPDATLLVDANEGWTFEQLAAYAPALASSGVVLLEQPLPRDQESMLAQYHGPVPLCADESCDTRADLDRVAARYQAINVKLDKAGGFTEALALARAARERGLGLMVGCMLGTSLAMAPAFYVAQLADFADLDGPLLQRADREDGLHYRDGWIDPPDAALWG